MNSRFRIVVAAVLLGLAFTVAAVWLPWLAKFNDYPERMQWLPWVMRLVGFSAYAVAGAFAGTRLVKSIHPLGAAAGARIGLQVGVWLAICAFVLSLVQWLIVAGQLFFTLGISYWVQRLLWSLLGVAIAATAGHIAASRVSRVSTETQE